MDVMESAGACRDTLDRARATGRTVGLGAHHGCPARRARLPVARARAECDVVAVSIFVNPLQFGDPEDIARYPRTIERDLFVCAEAGRRRRLRPGRARDVPVVAGAPRDDGVGVRRERPLGGCVAPGPLRRRRHGGLEAVRHRRPLPGLLRVEGLPAARRGPTHGARPVPAGRGGGVPDRAGGRRAGPLQPQRPAVARRAGGGDRPVARPGRRPGRARRRRALDRRRRTGHAGRRRRASPWCGSTTPWRSMPSRSRRPT